MEAVKGVDGEGEGRHRTHSSVSERIALWASLENGSHVEREEKRYSDDQPRLHIKTAHERESRAEDYAPRTAPATTDLAPFPSASRNRSLSATSQSQSGGDGGRFAVRHRHTQSVSSVHAPIPPPVYPVRSQPIGLLSRSSSLNNGTSTAPRPLWAEIFAGTCTSPVKRQALHRSESLPAFPPEHHNESSGTDRRRQGVSQDEFATLPCNPKHWRPSHLSLYLSATLSLPPPVREDITAFIVTSALSGRTFLRLREADLEEIGINVLWRKALVVARDALKWEATGGRTFWGVEGPSSVRDAGSPRRESGRLAQDRLDAYDSSASEDESPCRDEWKNSWKRTVLGKEVAGRVNDLRHTFEDVRDQEEPRLSTTGSFSPDSPASSHWRCSSTAAESLLDPRSYPSHEPTMRARCEDHALKSCDDTGHSRELPPPLPLSTSRPSRAPLPFLLTANLSAAPLNLTGGARAGRCGSDDDDEGDVSDQEGNTVRPVRARDHRLTLALGRVFASDAWEPATTRDISSAEKTWAERPDEDRPATVRMRVPRRQELHAAENGDDGTVRVKKGDLNLAQDSSLTARDYRDPEVARPLPDSPIRPTKVSVVAESLKEADVPFTVGGLEAGPEQLSILERRIQELEAEDEHVPYKNGPATEPACLAIGQELSPRLAHEEMRRRQDLAKPEEVPVVPSGAVSVISPEEANRSVLRRRPRPLSPTGDGTDELASGSGSTTEDTDGAWDVGRGGWPHDRIEGWRQLSGYVFAASVGIGIIVGEVVASRLLGLRRR